MANCYYVSKAVLRVIQVGVDAEEQPFVLEVVGGSGRGCAASCVKLACLVLIEERPARRHAITPVPCKHDKSNPKELQTRARWIGRAPFAGALSTTAPPALSRCVCASAAGCATRRPTTATNLPALTIPNPHQKPPCQHPLNNQAVLALVAFAAAAYLQTRGHREPLVNFTVFVGVVGWLLAILYAVTSCVEGLQRKLWGIVEVVISALWTLFWLSAAAALAADHRCKPSQLSTKAPFTECNAWLAAQAFAWMSLLLWIPSLAMAVVEWRRGEGLGGGVRY